MAPHLAALYVHPLKSGRGVRVPRAEVTETGLRDDRRWMVVDAAGRARTQREDPRLARIAPSFEGSRLRLSVPGTEDLVLPRRPAAGRDVPVTIWGDTLTAWSCGDAADAWIRRVLDDDARLVVFPPDARREVEPAHARAEDRVAFADAYPFHLTGTASLEDLNAHLDAPIEMVRFRPNLVVAGATAYAEDGWGRIRIGGVTFRVAKPCGRCVVPTRDPVTLRAGPEPLRTLARTRERDGKVLFGQNLLHDGTGTLSVGDAVEVIDGARRVEGAAPGAC